MNLCLHTGHSVWIGLASVDTDVEMGFSDWSVIFPTPSVFSGWDPFEIRELRVGFGSPATKKENVLPSLSQRRDPRPGYRSHGLARVPYALFLYPENF